MLRDAVILFVCLSPWLGAIYKHVLECRYYTLILEDLDPYTETEERAIIIDQGYIIVCTCASISVDEAFLSIKTPKCSLDHQLAYAGVRSQLFEK